MAKHKAKANKVKKQKAPYDIEKLYQQQTESDITVQFYDFAFTPIKTSGFTNYLKDEQEWMQKYKRIFGEIIPEIQGKNFSEIQSNRKYHFHQITENEHIKLCSKIICELYKKQKHLKSINSREKEYLTQKFLDAELYQIGINEIDCVRLVFIINNNTLEVIFFDMHHLIYNSIKYNDRDYQKYNFFPILELAVK